MTHTRPSDQYDADDMEEVGRRLMDTLHDNRECLRGWSPNDCPTEIVVDLINARDEAETVATEARAEAIAECAKLALEQRCERGTPWDRACVTIAEQIRALASPKTTEGERVSDAEIARRREELKAGHAAARAVYDESLWRLTPILAGDLCDRLRGLHENAWLSPMQLSLQLASAIESKARGET